MRVKLIADSSGTGIRHTFGLRRLRGVFSAIIATSHVAGKGPSPVYCLLTTSSLNISPTSYLIFRSSFTNVRTKATTNVQIVNLDAAGPRRSLGSGMCRIVPGFRGIAFRSCLG